MTLAVVPVEPATAPQRIAAVRAPGVVTVDNYLPDRERQFVLNDLRKGAWKYGWKSNGKEDTYSFWHRHFAGHIHSKKQKKYDCAKELEKSSPLMFWVWQQLAGTVFKGHTLIRCYANAHAYGIDGTIHTDSKSDNSHTAIYYPHAAWEPNWAGETVIFNATRDDIVCSVYPRPNRLLLFNGSFPHLARGVSRTCPELRITLMYKTVVGPLHVQGDADD
jgi:SM-20-related protein